MNPIRDNSPIFLKYPNYLADESYNSYSGFEWYYAAEIYGAFGNGCEARSEKGKVNSHAVGRFTLSSQIRE